MLQLFVLSVVYPNSFQSPPKFHFPIPRYDLPIVYQTSSWKKSAVPNFVGDSYHYLRGLSSLLFTIPLIFHAPFIRYFLPSIRWMTILTYARWINVLFKCHMGSSRVIPLSSGSSSAVGWLLLLTLCRSLWIVCKPWGPWCTSLG